MSAASDLSDFKPLPESLGPGRADLRRLSELSDPVVTSMLDYWKSKRLGKPMPGPDDLNPAEFARYMPNLQLIQVEHQPLDFTYRILGGSMAASFGGNHRGSKVRDLNALRPGLGNLLFELFRLVVERRRPFGVGGMLVSLEGRNVEFEGVHMPLSANGDRVDRILSASSHRQAKSQPSEARAIIREIVHERVD